MNCTDICYTIVDSSYFQKMTDRNLKFCLEYGTLDEKREALKEVIVQTANGECHKGYLILIIRFIMPLQDHAIRKLLLIFWEIYPKITCDGELVQEMILVCDAFRKDLQHPNEFVRGSTLRFLCKLKQPEILEPLIGCVRACLNHKRPYVRRNAVLAVYTIYKNHEMLIPDAPELVDVFLNTEEDTSCKRNAFIMLLNTDTDKAVKYLISSLDKVSSFDHSLQIVIIELIQKICRKNICEKSSFIRCIYSLLDSKSPSVRYEAARALKMLTNAPTALKASIHCYIDIILKGNDNTTKLIVMDQLVNLKYRLHQRRILQECVSDILSLLSRNNDFKVKIKIVTLVLDLITEHHAEQVVNVIKKECGKESTTIDYKNYKIFLMQKLHKCCLKFPKIASQIVQFLNEFLPETDEKVLVNVLSLLREAAQKFDHVRPLVISKLMNSLNTLPSFKAYSKALWILVEFGENRQDMENIIQDIYETMKEISTIREEEHNKGSEKTYVRLGAVSLDMLKDKIKSGSGKELTKLMIEDIIKSTGFIGVSVTCSVAKMMLKYNDMFNNHIHPNVTLAKAMYIISSSLHLNRLKRNYDSFDRLMKCLILLAKPNEDVVKQFLTGSRKALVDMLSCKNRSDRDEVGGDEMHVMQADEPICILQDDDQTKEESPLDYDYLDRLNGDEFEACSKLDRVVQLTGLSDPIYAETKLVQTSEQNIVLQITLINRTSETLQNCSVELASSGDIIIMDRPQPKIIGPKDSTEIKINVKVALTGNSIIFGNLVYDTVKISEHGNIVLNDIQIEIIDYIKPVSCDQDEFRRMWSEFEWENKVFLEAATTDLINYLEILTVKLHMKCLTPREAMSGECCFLTANLYAQSIFGENVIANLSLERKTGLQIITGHIRLRAKSQGIVLGLGEIVRNRHI